MTRVLCILIWILITPHADVTHDFKLVYSIGSNSDIVLYEDKWEGIYISSAAWKGKCKFIKLPPDYTDTCAGNSVNGLKVLAAREAKFVSGENDITRNHFEYAEYDSSDGCLYYITTDTSYRYVFHVAGSDFHYTQDLFDTIASPYEVIWIRRDIDGDKSKELIMISKYPGGGSGYSDFINIYAEEDR